MPRLSTSSSSGFRSLLSTFLWVVIIAVIAGTTFNTTANRYLGPNDRLNWIHDDVLSGKEPLDTLFLGSSKMRGCIDPGIAVINDNGHASLNLGLNGFGWNVNYVLLRDIFERRSVRRVVLEMNREMAAVNSHLSFPSISRWQDAVEIPFVRAFLPGLYSPRHVHGLRDLIVPFLTPPIHALRRVIDYYPDRTPEDHDIRVNSDHGGHIPFPVAKIPLAVLPDVPRLEVRLAGTTKSIQQKYPQSFYFELERISALCRANGVKLQFLHLPSYGYGYPDSDFEAELSTHGRVIQAPWKKYYIPDLWYDDRHLNHIGARIVSEWFAKNSEISTEKKSEVITN